MECYENIALYFSLLKGGAGMLIKLIIFLCHIQYKKKTIFGFYIKGSNEEYPKCLLYTENESVRNKMVQLYNSH